MNIGNSKAWPADVAERAGIGPAHPNHPYRNVYYGEDGQPLPPEVVDVNEQRALCEFPGFPDLVRTIVGAEKV